MSREFKFRAWDKKHKIMEEVDGIYLYIADGEIYEVYEETIGYDSFLKKTKVTEQFELMQYTGLHDCKTGVFPEGQEIFEGDIVKVFIVGGPFGGLGGPNDNKSGYRIGVIQFADGCFEIKFDTTRDYLKCYVVNNAVDVIGNIYENPELLDKSND